MMDKARYAAVDGIIRLHRGGYAGLVAKKVLSDKALSAKDKAFAGAVFYGTAERLGTLDALLQPFLKKPLDKMDDEVRAVLETGLYQIQYMNVPARAAVDEAVKLTRAFRKSSASGMVNAVLRKAQGQTLENLQFASELERVCAVWSVGEAVAKAVMAEFPKDYEEFLTASFAKKEICLRVNTLRTTSAHVADMLQQDGVATRAGQVEDCLYADIAGDIQQVQCFADGLCHVQGEASQIACACVNAQPGYRVLDVCAAPGGKSATLAQYMKTGGGLTACELRENRVPLIKETLARLGVENATVYQSDGTIYDEGLTGQDRVLCDVPCSGLGVLATKPDMRYNDGAGWDELPDVQLKILRNAARYVKRGGLLVYSTCTIRSAENGEVVRRFLQEAGSEYRIIPPAVVPKGAILDDEMMTILPQKSNIDGFFVACIERL